MSAPADYITVFRSSDSDASRKVFELAKTLTAHGLAPVVVNDQAPGVPAGCHEVRVPTAEVTTAEQILSTATVTSAEEPSLEAELIYYSNGSNAEIEAMGIKSLLEVNGIEAWVNSNSQVFSTPWEVHVAKGEVANAKRVLAEAQAAGPLAAEQAELEGEQSKID